MRGDYGCATAAKWVKPYIARVAVGFHKERREGDGEGGGVTPGISNPFEKQDIIGINFT